MVSIENEIIRSAIFRNSKLIIFQQNCYIIPQPPLKKGGGSEIEDRMVTLGSGYKSQLTIPDLCPA